MIKRAVPSDIDDIYDLFKEAHSQSCYSFISYDEVKVKKQIADFLLTGFAYIDEYGRGVLVAKVHPFWFNDEKTIASDLVFYVTPGKTKVAIQLIKKYIDWSEQHADYTGLSISIGDELMVKSEQFYERFGFKRVGGDLVRGF